MPIDPLQIPCFHIATPQEQDRDPDFLACKAGPGQPCTWAGRYDGVTDPLFHAERLEAAAAAQATLATANQAELHFALATETFREAILDTGLV